MKFWQKIENAINNLLSKLANSTKSLIRNLTPSKVKKAITTSSDKIESAKKELSHKLEDTNKALKEKKDQTKTLIQSKAKEAKETAEKAKSYDWKSLTAKGVFAAVVAFFAPHFGKLKLWMITLKPTTVASVIITGAATGLTGVTIYTQTQNIADKVGEPERAPASIKQSEHFKRRGGKLHLVNKRSLKLLNVKMPVYIESRKHLNNLRIDFTIVASNRYIKRYFEDYNNEILLRDKLSMRVQPFVTDFSLQEEGKKILREKLKKEINALVKELKIKGEVHDVYIHSLLAN